MDTDCLEIPPLFKMPMDQLLLDDRDVPFFIPVVCDFLRKFTRVEGIFRKSGSNRMVDRLGILLNVHDCAVPPCATVHDATSFLKTWLMRLPEPLIPPTLINEIYDYSDDSSIVTILRTLPVPNRRCLALIFAVIQDVIDHSDENKMNATNIATCFANALLKNREGIDPYFNFPKFFNAAVRMFNPEKNDFVFN